ncbi:MAG: oligosaccharide flippase family protein [Candidatus Peribacteraceae bacterium]|nr:oligosaccharide flippase family protein [Candidatus Peribacteraceae bacterium]
MRSFLFRHLRMPFVRDVATLQVGTFAIMGMQLVSSIIIARLMGPRLLGLYALTFTIIGTVGMLTDLGQNYSVTTLLPEAYGRKSPEEVAGVMRYFLRVALFWVYPVTLLLLVATPFVIRFFSPENDIAFWVQLGLLTLFCLPIHDLLSLTLQGARKIIPLTVVDIVWNALDICLPLLMLFWNVSVTALVLGRVASAIVKAVLSPLLWRYYLKGDSMLPSIPSLRGSSSSMHQGFTLGLWIAADKQMGKLAGYVPTYLLGLLGSATAIGQFRVLISYINIAFMFSGNVGRLMSSVLPYLYAKNTKNMTWAFWKGNIANMLLTFVILIPLMLLGNTGLTFLYGPAFALPRATYLLMLIAGIDGITVGFGSYYRIHHALAFAITSQIFAVTCGIIVWLTTFRSLPAIVAVILYHITNTLSSKVSHFINMWIIERRTRHIAQISESIVDPVTTDVGA